MAESSKIWIYQSNRLMTSEEVELINVKATDFVKSWESHGSKLKSDFTILYDLFVVFSVDENQHEASGCSIDKSVHFMKAIQTLTGITFFDRTIIAYVDNDNVARLLPLSNLKSAVASGIINNKTLVFNNLTENLGRMRTEWIIPASDSWLKRFL